MDPSRLSPFGMPLVACVGLALLAGGLVLWRGRVMNHGDPAPLSDFPVQADAQRSFNTKNREAEATKDFDRDVGIFFARVRADSDGDPVLTSALEALASDPAKALAIGRRLMSEFPDRAAEIGTILIGALVRASAHTVALELAQNGPEASRVEWMTLILSHWVQHRPEEAALIVDVLREKGISTNTFDSVAKGWAASAPEQLARYAVVLPPGEYRNAAFRSALDPWVLQDPVAVAAWLPQITEPVERDQVLYSLATHTDTAIRPISEGLRWAEGISNADLRRTALTQVIHEWFDQDPNNASQYVLTTPAFNAEQRQLLIASLKPSNEPP